MLDEKIMMKKHYLVADKPVLLFYNKTIKFSVFVNQKIVEIHNSMHPSPTTGSALWAMSADILALHKSLISLCYDGWSLATPIILRTMFEIFLAFLVITKSKKESDYFAFRYMYNFYKKQLKDPKISKEERVEAKKQINDGLKKLDNETLEKAKKFINEKQRLFWYSTDYNGPTDILEKFGFKEYRQIYELYSGASHGGLFGLGMFKGQVEKVHPNPRADKPSQNLALIHSNRIILESTAVRAKFEGLKIEKLYSSLFNEFLEIRNKIQIKHLT